MKSTLVFLTTLLAAVSAAPTSEPIIAVDPVPGQQYGGGSYGKPNKHHNKGCKPVYPGPTPVGPNPPINTVQTDFTQLAINLSNKESDPEIIKLDGMKIARLVAPGNPFNNGVTVNDKGDFFDPKTWANQDGKFISMDNRQAPVDTKPENQFSSLIFADKADPAFSVQGGFAQFSFRTFSGWLVCKDRNGPIVFFTTVGFNNKKEGCAQVKLVQIDSAIL